MTGTVKLPTRAEMKVARSRALHGQRVASAPTAKDAAEIAWGRIKAVFAGTANETQDAVAQEVTAALMTIADKADQERGSRD